MVEGEVHRAWKHSLDALIQYGLEWWLPKILLQWQAIEPKFLKFLLYKFFPRWRIEGRQLRHCPSYARVALVGPYLRIFLERWTLSALKNAGISMPSLDANWGMASWSHWGWVSTKNTIFLQSIVGLVSAKWYFCDVCEVDDLSSCRRQLAKIPKIPFRR